MCSSYPYWPRGLGDSCSTTVCQHAPAIPHFVSSLLRQPLHPRPSPRSCFFRPGALASSFCSYAFDLLMQHGQGPQKVPETRGSAVAVARPWEALHSKKGQVTRETCPRLSRHSPLHVQQNSAWWTQGWYVRAGCRCDYTYGIARVGSPCGRLRLFFSACWPRSEPRRSLQPPFEQQDSKTRRTPARSHGLFVAPMSKTVRQWRRCLKK